MTNINGYDRCGEICRESPVNAVGGHRLPPAPLINDHIVNKLDGNLR
jgi:hypothetical protein